jgi:hypothetical protein
MANGNPFQIDSNLGSIDRASGVLFDADAPKGDDKSNRYIGPWLHAVFMAIRQW